MVTCLKCGGSGVLPFYRHYANGTCFACGGTGHVATPHGPAAQVTEIEPLEQDCRIDVEALLNEEWESEYLAYGEEAIVLEAYVRERNRRIGLH